MIPYTKAVGGLPSRSGVFVSRVAAALLFAFILAVLPLTARADKGELTKNFDIPSGDAVSTLKQFNKNSGVQLVYLDDDVRGVTTNAVKGVMTAREALTLMLTKTSLEAVEDAQSGALTVRKRDAAEKSSPNPPAAEEKVVKLSAFDVSASSYSGYAASQTMSGSRVAMNLIDVPQSINVVTRAMIDDMGWQDPNSFLPASTAAVSGYGIPAPNQGLFIRGFRAQNWSVDGATEASFAQLDNFNYNAFEVVKGPSALLYGPFGAFGGYVNMIPKYAGEDGEVNQAQVTLGTSQYSSELLDYGQALNSSGALQGRLVLGEYDSNRAGKPGDFFHEHTFAPSFTYAISDRSKVKFRVDVESSHVRVSETAENADGVILRNYTDDGPEGLQPDLGTEDRSVTTQTIFTSQLSDEWSIKVNFMTEEEYYHANSITLAQNANTGLVGSLQYPQATYQYQKEQAIISFDSWYGSFTADWKKADLGHGLSNDLALSGDMSNWTDDYQYLGLSQTAGVYPQYNVPPYTTFNPSDPDYAAVANMNLTPPQQVQPYGIEWLGGLNAMDTFGMFDHKLQLVLGTRFNYDSRSSYTTTRSTATAPLTGSPSAAVTEELWLKRYGLVYQPTPHVALYYGHDEGYIAVGVGYTYQGALIKPQSGKENEVGIKTDLFHALGGDWSSTLAYFQLRVTNINLSDPAHFGYYLEEAAEQNDGFDAQITYMSDKLSGTIGVYDADGPYNPITNVRVPYAPKMTFVSWLRYNITPAISVGGGWRYQGNSLDGFSNNVLAPYNTLSLFATYAHKLGKGRVVYRLGVSNVTNATAAFMEVNPERIFTEDGREAKLSATYIW